MTCFVGLSGNVDLQKSSWNAVAVPYEWRTLKRPNADCPLALGTFWAQTKMWLVSRTFEGYLFGAGRGGRTPTRLPSADFEFAKNAVNL